MPGAGHGVDHEPAGCFGIQVGVAAVHHGSRFAGDGDSRVAGTGCLQPAQGDIAVGGDGDDPGTGIDQGGVVHSQHAAVAAAGIVGGDGNGACCSLNCHVRINIDINFGNGCQAAATGQVEIGLRAAVVDDQVGPGIEGDAAAAAGGDHPGVYRDMIVITAVVGGRQGDVAARGVAHIVIHGDGAAVGDLDGAAGEARIGIGHTRQPVHRADGQQIPDAVGYPDGSGTVIIGGQGAHGCFKRICAADPGGRPQRQSSRGDVRAADVPVRHGSRTRCQGHHVGSGDRHHGDVSGVAGNSHVIARAGCGDSRQRESV